MIVMTNERKIKMSGSIKEMLNDFVDDEMLHITYKDRDGKAVCVSIEKSLLKVADIFCAKKGIPRNELFRMVDAIAPEGLPRSKATRLVLLKIYFNQGNLDINA